jgi:glycosyltransferase involved in cell wall biosynthesis
MDKPLISVIMPVYNGERFLWEAIDSILNQSMTDFEFLIINDGSTDKSEEIIKSYVDTRIRFINNPHNLGLVDSLNKGIELAEGLYIARMDADDVSLPKRLEMQVRLIERENADICGCHWLVMSDSGKYIEAKLMPLNDDSFTVYLMYCVPFAHGSVLMRKSFIHTNDLKYEKGLRAEDYDLWTRFYEHGARFVTVDEFLFRYREHDSGISKRLAKSNAIDTKKIRRRFINNNTEACISAITNMRNSKQSLSVVERLYLILASFRLLTMRRCVRLFFKVIKRSDVRSLAIASLLIMKGY